jgi:hypothetical protein
MRIRRSRFESINSLKTFDDGWRRSRTGPEKVAGPSKSWRLKWKLDMSRFCFGSIRARVMCRTTSLPAIVDSGIPDPGMIR